MSCQVSGLFLKLSTTFRLAATTFRDWIQRSRIRGCSRTMFPISGTSCRLPCAAGVSAKISVYRNTPVPAGTDNEYTGTLAGAGVFVAKTGRIDQSYIEKTTYRQTEWLQ